MKGRSSGNKVRNAPVPRVALLDANVFFGPRMRDLFMHLHEAEVLNVHWTKEIEAEWARNVVAKQQANEASIQQCLMGMREAVEGWEVQGYVKYVELFSAVHEKDRHVAAAAHKLSLVDWPGNPVALVTNNLKDFPLRAFEGTRVVRFSPAEYLDSLYSEEPKHVFSVIERCRKKLKTPKTTREQYVAILFKNGCRNLAAQIAAKWSVECPVADKAGNMYYESDR